MYVSTPTNNKLRIETMISSDDDDDEGDLWEDMRVNYNYSYSKIIEFLFQIILVIFYSTKFNDYLSNHLFHILHYNIMSCYNHISIIEKETSLSKSSPNDNHAKLSKIGSSC